ncbi:MAG: DAK2 domain-containing protein [Actinomycetota bacterium]|nr:DAK2 domain-containing protein [Actinomycetota bacterium]
MVQVLDDVVARRWCAAALAAFTAARTEIDDLNVYPVPDGDTGTNLMHTMRAAAEALDAQPDLLGLGQVLHCMARGALLGGRGNSGVILSQVLRGAAESLAATPNAGGRDVAAALTRAADSAYAAVADPVEGTILSVARAAAEAAEGAGDDVAAVLTAAAAGASRALALTPQQLPALARAGVVDAGGRGLVVLLDALVVALTGVTDRHSRPAQGPLRQAACDTPEDGSSDFAYEVQYLLEAGDEEAAALRVELVPLGDSLLVAGTGDGVWNVHVHVDDVGAAILAGVRAGRPYRITVTRFADQYAHRAPATDRGVVAVADGAGLAAVLIAEGVQVAPGGPGRAPSTADLLAAIRRTGSAQVVVLPNDRNTQAVANAAAEEARAEGRTIAVVPTRSPVQGLAALAVRDPERRFADDVIAMAEAAGATRSAEVTFAVRDADTGAGPCRAGDVLGLVDGDVAVVGADVGEVARELLDRLLTGGGELVTLVVGAGGDPALGKDLAAHLRSDRPTVETVVYDGGQPHYPLLIGVE